MLNLKNIKELINHRKNKVLLIAQSSLTEHQYLAFRTLFLNEFGKQGLETELDNLFINEKTQNYRNGKGRNT